MNFRPSLLTKFHFPRLTGCGSPLCERCPSVVFLISVTLFTVSVFCYRGYDLEID